MEFIAFYIPPIGESIQSSLRLTEPIHPSSFLIIC